MTNAKVLRLTCPAPAKLNLFLHVVGRREDGYHLLQTVFRLIDFSDQLDFVLRHDGIVKLRSPIPGVPEDMDLCVRAARLLQQESGVSSGVDIFLEKRIPMGGRPRWRKFRCGHDLAGSQSFVGAELAAPSAAPARTETRGGRACVHFW